MSELHAARRIRLYSDGGLKQTILRILLFAEPTVSYPVPSCRTRRGARGRGRRDGRPCFAGVVIVILACMAGVVHRADEGEVLFGGRIVIKASFGQLCVTESYFESARSGADPHLHRRHADSFYVLRGELAVLVHDEEHVLGPGACVCAPASVVHAFRSTSPARFLNFHTPDAGFADNLRERNRGELGGFDSLDAEPGSGLPASNAVLLHAGEGERVEGRNRIATIKIGRQELGLVEVELEPGFEGPDPHAHDDHVDFFYVLAGEVEFQVGEEQFLAGAGSYVVAPPGVVHGFSAGPGPSRLLNVHAPSAGFDEWLREGG
jgi:quercetin dioxygenase-like cupin family protein